MVLGTTDGNEPWVSPVFFAADTNFNLYFISYNDSQHVINILKNQKVAVAIFDSNQVPGPVNGVQLKGTCLPVEKDYLAKLIEFFYTKRFPDPEEKKQHNLNVEQFTKIKGRVAHFYRVIPQSVYLLDNSHGTKDRRIEINIHQIS